MSLKEIASKIGLLPRLSVHEWLWQSHRIGADNFQPSSFAAIESEAADQEWPMIEGWENGTAILRRYLLATTAFKFGDISADEYLFYLSMNQKDAQTPFVPTNVDSVEVGLLLNVNLPFEDLVAGELLPGNTVLGRSLDLPEVQREGARWPFLKRILVHYGQRLQLSSDQEFHPSGFFMDLEFTASLRREIGYCKVSCFFESKLDPLRDFEGRPSESDYLSRDELGKIRSHLATEGWHCETQAEVDEFKRTYLRESNG